MKAIKYAAAGVVLGVVGAMLLPSLAQQTSPSGAPASQEGRTVTVTGTATVRSAPDEAVVSLGVQTHASSAQEALQQNADRMSAVLASLVKLGIGRDQVATSDVSLWPSYSNDGTGVTGYDASNQVEVTIRDLSRVGNLIDDAVGSGANLASGIRFQMSDENSGVTDSLSEAVADARRKAEALAAAGDASLGDVVSMTETGTPSVPPVYYEERAVAADASTPINPPTLKTAVSVTVTWTLV
jgi:uncharacterized protein